MRRRLIFTAVFILLRITISSAVFEAFLVHTPSENDILNRGWGEGFITRKYYYSINIFYQYVPSLPFVVGVVLALPFHASVVNSCSGRFLVACP